MADKIMETDEEYIDRLGGWDAALRRMRDEEMAARMNENRADLAQYDEMLGAQAAQAAQRRANGLRQSCRTETGRGTSRTPP